MSGLGGDEFFGGYSTFQNYGRLKKIKAKLNFIPNNLLKTFQKLSLSDRWNKLIEYVISNNNSDFYTYLSMKSLMHNKILSKLFLPKFDDFSENYFTEKIKNIKFHSDENIVSFLSQMFICVINF